MLLHLLLGATLAAAQGEAPRDCIVHAESEPRTACIMFGLGASPVVPGTAASSPDEVGRIPSATPPSVPRPGAAAAAPPDIPLTSLSGTALDPEVKGTDAPAADVPAPAPAPSAAEPTTLPLQGSVLAPAAAKPAEPKPAAPRERRGLPAPFESPPFPGSEYQGLPFIGIREDTGEQILMKILQGTGPGDVLLTHGIKMYGWIDVGANLSTSRNSNFPVAYDVFPNTAYLDQLLFRVQRVMDTAQTDHIEYGFKWDNLYGIDYRYTTMKGVFSEQLLKHNYAMGYDPVQLYGEMYIPWVAEGLILRLGRYVSPPDIEAELALENYLHTHSLTYAYDPYTQMGLLATVRLSAQWNVQAGITGTNDMAVWVVGCKPQGFLGARWVAKDNNDSVYAAFNSFNDGRYTGNHDALQDLVATWSHRFNPRIMTMTEVWYMWSLGAQLAGTEIDGPFKVWGGPSGGGASPIIPKLANEIATVNYTEFLLDKWNYITIRNEYFNDLKGQRTGFATPFSTHTIGWCHYVNANPNLQLRPEFSFDHSYRVPGFNAGTRFNQFMLAGDILIRF
jgi:hypothetical protein